MGGDGYNEVQHVSTGKASADDVTKTLLDVSITYGDLNQCSS